MVAGPPSKLHLLTRRPIVPLLALMLIFFWFVLPGVPFGDSTCDSWIDLGTFYTLPDAVHWHDTSRQLSRLAALLPGYVTTRVFNGVTADYALFVLMYGMAVACVYGTVRRLLRPDIALLSAMFVALQPIIIGNFSSTYTAPSLAYALLSLYFVARAVTVGRDPLAGWMLFWSGAAFGAAINAHLAVAAFALANYFLFALFVLRDMKIAPIQRVAKLAT